MDTAREFRRQSRLAVRGWGVSLEWWGVDGCVEAGGELVNISAGGALAVARAMPGLGQRVELAIEGLEGRSRLPAVVVGTRGGHLSNEVHLRFCGPCPPSTLAAVAVDRGP